MKKLFSGCLAISILLSSRPSVAMPTAAAGITGDVNGDGECNLADAVLLQKWLMGSGDLLHWQNADLNSDGKLDARDLTALKRLLQQPDEMQAMVYEAEAAMYTGTNQSHADQDASGGKTVGSFSGDNDTVTFTISIPQSGCYQLVFRSKGLGGGKENNVLVDGVQTGIMKSEGDTYTDSVLRSVLLTAGEHTVTVTKTWGWIDLDCLTIKPDKAISNAAYEVSTQLIDPNANEETQELFQYLCSNYGKYTLSGQVGNDGLNSDEFRSIYEVTGKYPAICGLDFMDYTPSRVALGARSNAVETAIDFHSHNGIVTFCWHWNAPTKYLKDGNDDNGNPRWWGGFNTANTNFDIDAVMNGTDSEGKALLDADIKEIAHQLHRLQEAGVPVLWRPLHEASGGWFWWGAKGASAYKKLWGYLYNQLTDVYNCHNLIWVWNGQAKEWYPGDAYVDIIGEDIYAGERMYAAHNAKFAELLEYPETNKMIALTENGTVFDIDNVIAANAHWAWFGTWCGDFVTRNGHYCDQFTEADIMKKTYQSDAVITLDELPVFLQKTPATSNDARMSEEAYRSYASEIINGTLFDAGNLGQMQSAGAFQKYSYFSSTAGRESRVNVLLPPDYDPKKEYPVLYILHGYYDNEDWMARELVGIPQMLQQLYQQNKAKEMIVVCPYIFVSRELASCTGMDWQNTLAYDNFVNDLTTDLMPFIEQNFSVKKGREHTAITGFSMGGRESLFIGITHPELFGYIGACCPAPGVTDQVAAADMRFAAGYSPRLLLISAGSWDGVVGSNPENYHKILSGNGVTNYFRMMEGTGHDHTSVTPHLYQFFSLAFQ